MMLFNPLNKLPYPTFLETTRARIELDGEVLWEGLCFFMQRASFKREVDGVLSQRMAKATISEDFGDLYEEVYKGVTFVVVEGEKRYIIEGLRRTNNPDGSFHHWALELVAEGL